MIWWILGLIANTILFIINLTLDIVLSMLGIDKGKSRGKRK